MLNSALKRTENYSHWKRLGKVKLGLKVKSQKLRCQEQHQHKDDCYFSYPKDVDYFVLPEKWRPKLGEQPKKLQIMLAFPTLIQNFDIRAAVYRANGSKWCSTSDDVKAKRLTTIEVPNPKFGKGPNEKANINKADYKEIDCPNTACEYRIKGDCKPRAYFDFMVPALLPEVGTLHMKVGSRVSQDQILATLQALEYFCRERPNGMQGVRMVLERELVTFNVDTKGDGTLTKIEKWIPKLSIDYTSLRGDDQALLGPIVGQELVIPEKVHALEIAATDDDDDEEFDRKADKLIDQPPALA